MRVSRFFIVVLILLLPAIAIAQNGKVPDATIIGRVVDDNGKPMTDANVAVYDSSQSNVIAGVLTNKEGRFTINLKPGRYVIKITFLSFKTYQQSVTAKAGQSKSLGTIQLQPNSKSLGLLIVRPKQSQMTLGFDKRIFNVGRDITSMGGSVVNVLRNVPSVSININGKISLRGNRSVRILINGHPSTRVSNGIQALSSIPANLIQDIEIITNPSAKYSAEGTAGIINIVLVKNRKLGFNGSVAAGSGYPQNHELSANLNYQKGNFNWFTNAGLGYKGKPEGGKAFQRYAGPDTTYMYRERTHSNEHKLIPEIRIGADYYLSKTQTLTASSFMSFETKSKNKNYTYTNLQYSHGAFKGNVLSRNRRDANENKQEHSLGFRLHYANKIKGAKHKLTAGLRFELERKHEDTGINESEILDSRKFLSQQRSRHRENENTFRLNIEYKQPLGNKGTLETGLRSHIEWNKHLQGVEVLHHHDWMLITSYNGNFLFLDNVNAAYLILGAQAGNFSGEVGVRAENTRIRTEVKSENKINKQNYINLFPSIFLNYAFNDRNSIQLSYSRRLTRPDADMLLPFSDYHNSRRQQVGNPSLRPEFSHSYEGGYLRTWKRGSLLTSFYYRHRMDGIEDITVQKQGALVRFPINLSSEKAWGMELSAKQHFFQGLSLQANMNFYRSNRHGKYKKQLFESKAQTIRARASLRWDLLNVWHFQATCRYMGPHTTTQGRMNGIKTMDIGLAYDLLNEKAKLSLSVQDVFNSQNFNNILTSNGRPDTDFYYRYGYRDHSRTFSLIFRYFF